MQIFIVPLPERKLEEQCAWVSWLGCPQRQQLSLVLLISVKQRRENTELRYIAHTLTRITLLHKNRGQQIIKQTVPQIDLTHYCTYENTTEHFCMPVGYVTFLWSHNTGITSIFSDSVPVCVFNSNSLGRVCFKDRNIRSEFELHMNPTVVSLHGFIIHIEIIWCLHSTTQNDTCVPIYIHTYPLTHCTYALPHNLL